MSSSVKDVIVDAGGKRDTAASPSTPLLLPSDCPRNSSVRRLRSDIDLEEKPHSCHIAFCRTPYLFQLSDINVRVCGIPTVLTGGQDLGRGSRLSSEGGCGKTWGVLRPGYTGSSRVVKPSGDCSCL